MTDNAVKVHTIHQAWAYVEDLERSYGPSWIMDDGEWPADMNVSELLRSHRKLLLHITGRYNPILIVNYVAHLSDGLMLLVEFTFDSATRMTVVRLELKDDPYGVIPSTR